MTMARPYRELTPYEIKRILMEGDACTSDESYSEVDFSDYEETESVLDTRNDNTSCPTQDIGVASTSGLGNQGPRRKKVCTRQDDSDWSSLSEDSEEEKYAFVYRVESAESSDSDAAFSPLQRNYVRRRTRSSAAALQDISDSSGENNCVDIGLSCRPHSVQLTAAVPTSAMVTAPSMTPSAVPTAALPPSTVPAAAVPPSTVPAAAVPPSTVPAAAVPPSTVPAAAVPPSTVPAAAVPPSTAPAAAVQPSTVPVSTVPTLNIVQPPVDRVWNWQKDALLFPDSLQFDATKSGILPNCPVTNDSIELDYFQLFFDETLMKIIVTRTNSYYQHTLANAVSAKSQLRQWKDTTVAEMYLFFATLMLMSHIRKTSISKYWSINKLIATPAFREIMSLDRFLLLLRMLHFSDKSNPQRDDLLYKIREVTVYLKQKFSEFFYPFKNIVINESSILFKGTSIAVFMPNGIHAA
ncbi:uncharacterized protein [Cherax quadricarinatus]|uniref:uncharacterized protein isoform X2 n=1 Tax=Cherax quadricarinatus TaxID=27406 RepID=UPI00387E5FD4